MRNKKFVKTFRNTKTVQLVLLLLLEAAYVLVLTLNPALGTKLFEDRTLQIEVKRYHQIPGIIRASIILTFRRCAGTTGIGIVRRL